MKSCLDFVSRFSKINVTRNGNLRLCPSAATRREAALLHVRGNSRDEPSLFLYSCKNSVFGCDYTSKDGAYMRTHERTCRRTSIEASTRVANKIPCTQEGCSVRVADQKSLKTHLINVHGTGEKRKCPYAPDSCDIDVDYTPSKLKTHIDHYHMGFPVTRCPLASECGSLTEF